MRSVIVYCAAALCEIGGCFAFWAWLRLARSPFWLAPGIAALLAFAALLTLVQTDAAGRAYAAYGGIYIISSLMWLWRVEGIPPDRFDFAGGALCLAGAAVILFAPRVR